MARPKTINPNGDTKPLAIRISADDYERLRFVAEAHKMSIAAVVRNLIDKHFVEHPVNPF
jgi:predicted DNA-binding protein